MTDKWAVSSVSSSSVSSILGCGKLAESNKMCTFAVMKSKLLKLDAPYQVIYAGGKVGRHIATLMVWNDDDENGGIFGAASYPVIDEGEEFPAGTLCEDAELHDCRTLCPPEGTNLTWVAKIIEYDFQQLEPAGAEYILERMKLLGCKIAMPTEKDKETGEELYVMKFNATLDVMCLHGFPEDENAYYRVRSNRFEGFYFQAEGTAEEVYQELSYQLSVYMGAFYDDIIYIRFQTTDGQLTEVTNRLNANQHIEGFEHED